MAGLILVLAGALGLRLWGLRQGLPFAYNSDEDNHFLGKALEFFSGDYNPHYFVNPPAYSYLLHVVYLVGWQGDGAVAARSAGDADVFALARAVSAVIGTVGVGLIYLAGARMFDRRVGFLAALLAAVSVVTVVYSRLALNDVPAMAGAALALYGVARALDGGPRRSDLVLAAVGVGLAASTKYTAGIAVVPLALVLLGAWMKQRDVRKLTRDSILTGVVAGTTFVTTNPFILASPGNFLSDLRYQSEASNDVKLGQSEGQGIQYYAETLTWSLGWVAVAAMLAGLVLLARQNRLRAAVLAVAPILFILFMGRHERYFARWLLPVYPMLCLLAAYGMSRAIDLVAERRGSLAPIAAAVGAIALIAQPLLASTRSAATLTEESTTVQARDWLRQNVPGGSRVVLDPTLPAAFNRAGGPDSERIWRSWIDAHPPEPRRGIADDFAFSLSPAIIERFEREGYCWVVSSEGLYDRVFEDADRVPHAVRYYRALDAEARRAYVGNPLPEKDGPPRFGRAKVPVDRLDRIASAERPGRVIMVHRLSGGRCGALAATGSRAAQAG